MLGVFAKVVRGQQVKSRLQTSLSRQDAERFYVASLADTLESALRVQETPVLFLYGGEDPAAVDDLRTRLDAAGLESESWARVRLQTQHGRTLGERLEHAFATGPESADAAALIVGADSPSLTPPMLRRGFETLASGQDGARPPDVVLGPTEDGGYWSIGMRQAFPGLLAGIAWSTPRALVETMSRCRQRGLHVGLLDPWTDVDHPDDLRTLASQVAELRAVGDVETARHVEPLVQKLVSRLHGA